MAALPGALCLIAVVLQIPRPLVVHAGRGDERLLVGVAGGGGRHEKWFRWLGRDSRLELPLWGQAEDLEIACRVARFGTEPADVIVSDGRRAVRWVIPPRLWEMSSARLGEFRGRISITFSAPPPRSPNEGVLIDRIELRGVRSLHPDAGILLRLAVLLASVTTWAYLAGGRLWATGATWLAGGVTASLLLVDRLGALLAAAEAALPVAMGLALMVALRRFGEVRGEAPATMVPAAACLVWSLAVFHPFYYYADVDTHSSYLAALRAGTNASPADFDIGARRIGGQYVAFPYSPVFYWLAAPLGSIVGDTTAVKVTGVLIAATSCFLVHGFARHCGLAAGWALWAQVVFVLQPATSWRLTWALYPTLAGQLLEILVVRRLVRGPETGGARARTSLLFGIAALVYPGTVLDLAVLAVVFGALEMAFGDFRGALLSAMASLAAIAGASAAAYAGPALRLLTEVAHSPEPLWGMALGSAGVQAATRLRIFYDGVLPVLVIVGCFAIRGGRPRRVLVAVLLTAALLMVGRYLAPTLLRDAKEVELAAPSIAVSAAMGSAWLWSRGRALRVLALLGMFTFGAWGGHRALGTYLDHFGVVGVDR